MLKHEHNQLNSCGSIKVTELRNIFVYICDITHPSHMLFSHYSITYPPIYTQIQDLKYIYRKTTNSSPYNIEVNVCKPLTKRYDCEESISMHNSYTHKLSISKFWPSYHLDDYAVLCCGYRIISGIYFVSNYHKENLHICQVMYHT